MSFKFRPRELLGGAFFEVPPFVTFAFLAGVGAQWLTDRQGNYALPMVLVLCAWLFSLWIRTVLRHQRLWLQEVMWQGRYLCWRLSMVCLGVAALCAGLVVVVVHCATVGLGSNECLLGGAILMLGYVLLGLLYTYLVVGWNKEDYEKKIRDALRLYCQKSPDGSARVSENPSVHQGQPPSHFHAKFYAAQASNTAGQHCCCLERELVERTSDGVHLPETELRLVVRGAVNSTARQYALEYHTLAFIVAQGTAAAGKYEHIVKNELASETFAQVKQFRDEIAAAGAQLDVE